MGYRKCLITLKKINSKHHGLHVTLVRKSTTIRKASFKESCLDKQFVHRVEGLSLGVLKFALRGAYLMC